MQSWWLNTEGAQARLELRTVPQPEPGPGQVLLRMHSAGLNRGEFIVGVGLTKAGSAKAVGIEGAGEVAALGAGVSRWKVGDRVMGRFGAALSEYAVAAETDLMAVPAGMPWEHAGAIPTTYMVAHDMVVTQGGLQRGGWLLVAGASSGVGVASLQLAKALGARVIGTSGSRDKLDRLAGLGLDVPICTRQPDFVDQVMEATGGKGVNLAVNTVGGTVFEALQRCLGFQGRLAMVGYVDGVLTAPVDLQALHVKRQVLFGVSNKLVSAAHKAEATAAFVAEVLPFFAQGNIHPVVDHVFPFAQAPEARSVMESNVHLGKIVVTM